MITEKTKKSENNIYLSNNILVTRPQDPSNPYFVVLATEARNER